MESIARPYIRQPLHDAQMIRDKHGTVISRPQLVYDPEVGMVAYDDIPEPQRPADGTTPDDAGQDRQRFDATLLTVCERARAALPEVGARLGRAYELVLAGLVTPQADGKRYLVASQSQEEKSYVVDGACTCPDHAYAPGHWCTHAVAVALYKRTMQHLHAADLAPGELPLAAPPGPDLAPSPTSELEAAILQQYTIDYRGTQAVRYFGLLMIARLRGLTSLKEQWIHNEPELSLASALATFADGTVWHGCGDATPANVSKLVAPHFRRMALTRAKARALRDALGINIVAEEELD